MTIASEITRIKTNISNAYDALEEKGATIPTEKNSANLVSTIDTITVGSPDYLGRIITDDGVFGYPTLPFSFSLPNTVTSIGGRALYYMFYGCTNLASVDLSSVTSIGTNGLNNAFNGCESLASVDLSSVTSIGNRALYYTFQNCTSLTSIDLHNVITISNNGLSNTFYDCTNLTSVALDSLQSVSGFGMNNAFYRCTSLSTLSFPSLSSSSLVSNNDQFSNMLNGVTGCTVHFPSNLESVIGSWGTVTNGFGGTNTTVLFDLPATT